MSDSRTRARASAASGGGCGASAWVQAANAAAVTALSSGPSAPASTATGATGHPSSGFASRPATSATDGHKWLNLPYDNAMVLIRSAEAHRRAMTKDAAYAMSSGGLARDPERYVPEFSRRARGVPLYAALRSLGREGIADLIACDCDLAQRFATGAGALDGVSVVNDVVLNQVLLRFEVPGCGDEDALSHVLHEVHAAGVFWAGRTTSRSSPGMRV